jgi:hypothetical protein
MSTLEETELQKRGREREQDPSASRLMPGVHASLWGGSYAIRTQNTTSTWIYACTEYV